MKSSRRDTAEKKTCQSCGNIFECKAADISGCGCNTINLSEETRAFVMNTYHDCICKICLVSLSNSFSNVGLESIIIKGTVIKAIA